MSNKYTLHFTFDKKSPNQKEIPEDISNYIVVQNGRDAEDPPPFNVLRWLRAFYGQEGLPVLRPEDIDELPDQRLQETMEDYQLFTPTVKDEPINLYIERKVSGFPLVEDKRFNIVRSYPADEQYDDKQNLPWIIGNSYFRAGTFILKFPRKVY